MAAKRIARELSEIDKARAEGDPYTCGLAITCNHGDAYDWLCTYSCPQHYVYHGLQRVSPYAGFVLRFRIQFPTDYPFKPFKLLIQRTFDFFHPLISCAPDTGLCAAFIHRVPFFEEEAWNPAFTVHKLLEEYMWPMWTDADGWVAEQAKFNGLPNLYCPHSALFLDDVSETAAVFPHDLPCFQGELVHLTIEKRAQAAERLSSAARELEILAEEAAAPPKPEASFEIIAKNRSTFRDVRIQVLPSFRVHRLLQVVSDATGIPVDRFRLIFAAKELGSSNRMLFLSDFHIQEGSCVHVIPRLRGCRPYTTNGSNPAAAHLLLTDVQRFEQFARQSWFAQRVPRSMHLIARLSSIVLPCPLSLQLQPQVSPPLPLPCITDLRHMLVFSGWTMCTLRALVSKSPSISRRDAEMLVLCVRRRVLGSAGVLRLAGCDPSAPPPPGTRASGFGCVAVLLRE
jgi:ubiquitin-protein ligase